ncbi:MAG: glycyl radical enzyme [Bacteroidetes bacterium GWF2_38_335]|nr:MAG: glycyl radical enzyme [Bacteroidetes bacterium GWF2_38_335]OFY80800.1 MAG: glycyl radical enzyme [Bacteroidetes bacterium RIFOXYA12_FULL_38_20]HBS86200.1 formate C-acetyltransferase/glycerol dehydratase family glycyl radical enzyme [Bacteroidales bacterium]
MNKRIQKLRNQSLNAVNKISHERAVLVTEFYRSIEGKDLPVPIQRALCFKYIFENKKLCINSGELIVGERGPAPKETSTFPEICLHSVSDLDLIDIRPKVSFKVSDQTRKIYEKEIIPFWTGKTNREKLFSSMSPEWLDAYEAGIFTEFQEQRAPGHTVLGDVIYRKGMLDIIDDIDSVMAGAVSEDEKNELEAMKITARALISFAERYARLLDQLAEKEKIKRRKSELEQMAEICRHVPAHAPRTFHEALQYYWFVHLGVITELNPWDSFNPGRLDRNLFPFYHNEINSGTLNRQKAEELLQCFWIKFNNQPAPPKMGVTAKESNTYTDFALINLGGLNTDGSDAVNELTYLLLDVIEEMRLLQPSSMIQVSHLNPDAFIHRALKIIKTGFGQPSVFNTDAIIKELTLQGKSLADARNGGCSGCVEVGAFGTESYTLTGYFNLPKIMEITLNDGCDPLTGKFIGVRTGNPCDFKSFEELMNAFKKQLFHFANIKIEGNNKIEKLFACNLPVPFLSLLTDDCINNKKDYNAGGARYNTSYIQGVGLGSLTDILTTLKFHVYDEKTMGMGEILGAVKDNFQNFEAMRYILSEKTPKYGNDDDYADDQAKLIFEIFNDAVNARPTYKGGKFRINFLPTTCHVYFGSKTGATPDGRLAGVPLSEGISPVQGADRNGPTAVLKSASKIDHIRTGGTLLNQKFSPSFFRDEESIQKIGYLIRSYFRMDGHHIQFNVVNAETLRKAKIHPENYRDLIVRVAGYSDYFNDLGEELQDEIIRRTEHESAGF